MPKQRLLIFICIALTAILILGGLLGSLLRIINELRYSLELFLPYWLVGPFILISFILILILIVQIAWPWWQVFLNKKFKDNNLKGETLYNPTSRRQAARKSLESIDQLIEKLQDTVARESLKQERKRVERQLAKGDLIVVVFGSGSSGKTSLIRAILNEIVGEVGAAMGSTSSSKSYRLRLKGLNRGLQIVDTPGILEGGANGQEREKESKKRASQADLMIFVVDGDLRSSEFEIIHALSNLGKRFLLVLNKIDLRGEREEEKLLHLLRNHCKNLMKEEDVISASAAPQSIPRPGKKPWQPTPEVNQVLRRLAQVLHEEGEDLLADNMLLQCRNLGQTGRHLLDSQRKKLAKKCIDRYSWISSGVIAANPLPGVDLLGTAAVNVQMVMEISRIYGVQITKEKAQELTVSVGRTLAGLGVVKGGVSLIGTALSLNLPTFLLGRAVQSVAAAWLTRVAGASFITFFQQDQDWGDGGIQEVVQRHYDLNRRDSSLKKFLETAFRRVVEPLQKTHQRQLPPRPTLQEEEAASDHEHRGK